MAFKFNPLTGQLDIAGTTQGVASPDNFSFTEIVFGVKKTIPPHQQMLIASPLTIDGFLTIDGSLVEIVEDRISYPAEFIPPQDNVLIPYGQVMPFFTQTFEVDGTLIVDGHLLEILQ